MTRSGGPAQTGIAIAALCLTATLVLAGCGENVDDGAAGTSVSPSATPTPEATSLEAGAAPGAGGDAENGPSDTPATTPEPSTAPQQGSERDYPTGDQVAIADCLPGNWIPHREEFATMMAGDTTKLVTGIDGNMFLSIQPDGTVNTTYENWTYTFTVKTATVTIVKDGIDEGEYTVADDGAIDITDTNIDSTTDARMTINGTEMAQVIEPQPSVFSLATISCSGDELTASVGSQSAVLGREH
ncbi:hypothetical protein [Demequina aurantiaca]|uniref:hypothetical protein n=1 Tax=Demequina aurantiaca TaxID=676200 RepID=UPI003D354A34